MQDSTRELRIMRRRGRPRKSSSNNSPIRKTRTLRLTEEKVRHITVNARRGRKNPLHAKNTPITPMKKSPSLEFKRLAILCVGVLGLEPRMTGPESVVLPLHHTPILSQQISFNPLKSELRMQRYDIFLNHQIISAFFSKKVVLWVLFKKSASLTTVRGVSKMKIFTIDICN